MRFGLQNANKRRYIKISLLNIYKLDNDDNESNEIRSKFNKIKSGLSLINSKSWNR